MDDNLEGGDVPQNDSNIDGVEPVENSAEPTKDDSSAGQTDHHAGGSEIQLSDVAQSAIKEYGIEEAIASKLDDSGLEQLMVNLDRQRLQQSGFGRNHQETATNQSNPTNTNQSQFNNPLPGSVNSLPFGGSGFNPNQPPFTQQFDQTVVPPTHNHFGAAQLPTAQHGQPEQVQPSAPAPNWDDFDEQARNAFGYLNEQLGQQKNELAGQVQQLQAAINEIQMQHQQVMAQPYYDGFDKAVDGLKSDFYGQQNSASQLQNTSRDQLWETMVALANVSDGNFGVESIPGLVVKANRLLQADQFVDRNELIRQAQKQSSQIIGKPSSNAGGPVSAEQKAMDVVNQFTGGNEFVDPDIDEIMDSFA